jgi:hypothetical protein
MRSSGALYRNVLAGALPGSKSTIAVSLVMVAFCLFVPTGSKAQVTQSAEKGGPVLSAGGTFSGYYVGFGQRKMAGPTAFVDFGSRAPLTFEAEVRWLDLNEIAGVHTTTYLGGPRYSFRQGGRLRPYAKVLLGDGEFSFPYGLAHGSYFVVAPGAGLEYQWNHRVYFRLIDAEYQYWNQFTYGSLPTYGVSSGLRIRIF